MTIQCLCEICNCGKHHCPLDTDLQVTPQARDELEDELLSEYKREFKAHVGAKVRKARRQKDEYCPPEGNMARVTTCRSDYVEHPLIRQAPRVPPTYSPPEGNMMMMTTYCSDYHPHVIQRRTAIGGPRPDDHQPSTAKMNGMSTYKDSFRTWPLQKRQAFRLSDNLTLNSGKFCATTTFRDDYRPFVGVEMRKPFRPATDATSTIRLEQTGHVPFTTATNYRLQYVPPPAEALKRPMSAPRQASSSHRPNESFQGTTEFCEKFQPWAVSTRKQGKHHEEEVRVNPKGHMTFDSTTHDAYVRHEGPPADRPIVKQAWTSKHEVHDGDNRGRQRERRSTGKEMVPKAKPSATSTTYRSQYTPKTAPLPVRVNPTRSQGGRHSAPHAEDVDTDEDIHQRDHQMAPCPASFIQPPGFEDTHMTCKGHRLYRTISPEETATESNDAIDDAVSDSQSIQGGHGNVTSRKGVSFDGRGRGQH